MQVIKKKTTKLTFGSFLLLILVTLGIYVGNETNLTDIHFSELFDSLVTQEGSQAPDYSALADVPDYGGGEQEITINDNLPDFTADELSLAKGSWEEYSPLDSMGRVGVANAMLGKELLPTEKRESLTVNPTGWNQLEIGNNQWLYNRSHLIGFQLTGQNNNETNLMTGTRSLNSPYMLLHENDIIYYIKETGNHVRYQVTPYFKGTELTARGVQLQAKSIEDVEISFNVFIYNIQEGYTIDYQTGQATAE